MPDTASNTLDLDAYWMAFTSNRNFKQNPRLIESAAGHYYRDIDGNEILDAFSGLWTCGLGHSHPKVVSAIQQQAATLDYAPAFQMGHPKAFQLADKLAKLAPEGIEHVFFTNSGSEAVDTALKIALAYQRQRGQAQRTHLVGRVRAYHGVNFGGMSVGGIPPNRMLYGGSMIPNVSHLPTTHNLEHNAFSRGQPEWGAHLAEDLNNKIMMVGGENIAAVIVEPVAGSTGVLIPPIGYLEKLREICDQHDILLIFDEVITGFGRVGAPFAAQRFDVIPDMITTAKGVTNGAVPLGVVLVKDEIHEAFMHGPPHAVEFFHGYTYSGHPLAMAAGLGALAAYEEQDSFNQSRQLETVFEDAIHAMADARHVIDIRNFGLMGAVELAPRPGAPGARGLEVLDKCFRAGVQIRNAMDILQFCPFLDSTADEFDRTFSTVRKVLESVE